MSKLIQRIEQLFLRLLSHPLRGIAAGYFLFKGLSILLMPGGTVVIVETLSMGWIPPWLIGTAYLAASMAMVLATRKITMLFAIVPELLYIAMAATSFLYNLRAQSGFSNTPIAILQPLALALFCLSALFFCPADEQGYPSV